MKIAGLVSIDLLFVFLASASKENLKYRIRSDEHYMIRRLALTDVHDDAPKRRKSQGSETDDDEAGPEVDDTVKEAAGKSVGKVTYVGSNWIFVKWTEGPLKKKGECKYKADQIRKPVSDLHHGVKFMIYSRD